MIECINTVEKTNRKRPVFSKQAILESRRFLGRADVLKVLLEDEKMYSFEDVEEILKKFMGVK